MAGATYRLWAANGKLGQRLPRRLVGRKPPFAIVVLQRRYSAHHHLAWPAIFRRLRAMGR